MLYVLSVGLLGVMASNTIKDEAHTPPLLSTRKRRSETWLKSQEKRQKAKRDSDEDYVDRSGAAVEGKRVGPACTCKNKCYGKVGVVNVNSLFKAYWALESRDLQSEYINARVHTEEIPRLKVKGREARKKQGKTYTVVVNNVPIKVCSIAFLNIHAITDKQVQNALAKASLSPIATDQHRHQEPVNETARKLLEIVEEFCKRLPTCQFHNPKAKKTEKLSLPPGSTWTSLYESFQDYMEKEGVDRNAVILSQFIAKVRDYKTSITTPKSDTCSTCDAFRIQLESLDHVTDEEKIGSPTLKRYEHYNVIVLVTISIMVKTTCCQ